jgi:hypothetical protein
MFVRNSVSTVGVNVVTLLLFGAVNLSVVVEHVDKK